MERKKALELLSSFKEELDKLFGNLPIDLIETLESIKYHIKTSPIKKEKR